MPRRRWQLIHLLADSYAFAVREVYGDRHVYPQDFYDSFRQYSPSELQEMAIGISPRSVGRPKSWRSRYAWPARQVDKVLKSGKRKSERGACRYVAGKYEVSEKALRTYYRDRHARS